MTEQPYPTRQEIIDADAELRRHRAFMAEVAEAIENGCDWCCVECGTGIAGDGMEMHAPGCSRAPL